MPRTDVQIPTRDGVSSGSLHVPQGEGPWPGVVMFPDAFGLRETMREMGDHLAGLGYVVLVPDVFYREGAWAPFDPVTAFTDEGERDRLFGLVRSLDNDRIVTDSACDLPQAIVDELGIAVVPLTIRIDPNRCA